MYEWTHLPSFYHQKIQIIALWIAESSVEIILALNRCLFFAAPNLSHHLFGSSDAGTAHRVWFWLVPPTLWGLYYLVWGTPAIFTSIYHIETWNPHRGYFDDLIKNVCFYLIDWLNNVVKNISYVFIQISLTVHICNLWCPPDVYCSHITDYLQCICVYRILQILRF